MMNNNNNMEEQGMVQTLGVALAAVQRTSRPTKESLIASMLRQQWHWANSHWVVAAVVMRNPRPTPPHPRLQPFSSNQQPPMANC
jgi:hypothetical protein